VVESVGVVSQIDRFKFEVPYVVKVGNVGSARVYKAQVDNHLGSTFSASSPVITVKGGSLNVSGSGAACVINTGFNGLSDTRLLNGLVDLTAGSSCEIRFVATVDYSNAGTVPSLVQHNRSFGSGDSYLALVNNGSSSGVVFETSDYSTNIISMIDENGYPVSPGLPNVAQSDVASMTGVSLKSAIAKVDVVLGVGTPVQSGYEFNLSNQLQTYTFDVPMKVLVGVASGAGVSYGVQANMPFRYIFTDGNLLGIGTSTRVKAGTLSVVGVNGAVCTVNSRFNGDSDTRLLSGTNTVKGNQGCLVSYVGQVIYQGKTNADQPHVYPLNRAVFSVMAYGSSVNIGMVNVGHSFSYNNGVLIATAPSGYTSLDGSTSAGAAQAGNPGELATVADPVLPNAPGGDDPGMAVNIRLSLENQTVSGVAYIDKNSNGKLDENLGEALEGILVDIVDERGKTPLRVMIDDYEVSSLNTISDGSGRYAISGVPPGLWTFRFRRGGDGSILYTANGVPVLYNNASVASSMNSLPQNSAAYIAISAQYKALNGKSIKPNGFVYDSITKERYGNVRLYLKYCGEALTDTSCLSAGESILPIKEIGGVLSVATDTIDKGAYGFNLLPSAPAGVYRIDVEIPSEMKMSYPSAIWSPETSGSTDSVPVIRDVDGEGMYHASTKFYPITDSESATRYYRTFRLEKTGMMSKMVANHIPLDKMESLKTNLFIRKEADRKQVEIGETVLYRITLRASPYAFNPASVYDTLPLGFKLIPGTAKRMNTAGVMELIPERDMEGGVGPILTFKNLYLKHAKDYAIEYRVRANVGSDRGTGINSAYGVMGGGADKRMSETARVKVKVSAGVFTKEGCVLGKVYMDCSGNNQQDEGELGVPGVVMVLQDGTSITTDANGQYSLCGLKPITSVIKLDEWTLPEGSQLGLVDSRNVGNPNSRFVDVKDGELHRADFRVLGCSKTLMDNLKNRIKQLEDKNPPTLPIKGEVSKADELESKVKAKSNPTFSSKKNPIRVEKKK
jgi:uncharacterized repeat protein (TIGR01451 family)